MAKRIERRIRAIPGFAGLFREKRAAGKVTAVVERRKAGPVFRQDLKVDSVSFPLAVVYFIVTDRFVTYSQANSSKLASFLKLVVERLNTHIREDKSASTLLLSQFLGLITKLDGILALPRGKGRQNLVNSHSVGSDLMHPASTLVKSDREFSRLVVEILEAVRAGLRLTPVLVDNFRFR